MGVPSEIYYGQQRLIEVVTLLSKLPARTVDAIITAKDLELRLRECENCGDGPDSYVQNTTEQLICEMDEIKQRLLACERELNDMIIKFNWNVEYDEDREEYYVTGPCTDSDDETDIGR